MTHPSVKALGNGRCLIIAEVGLAHDGSLSLAHDYIDAVAKTGADAVKFQTHIAEAESTSYEPFRVPMSGQDKTRWDYWKRTAFTEEQWKGLADHASDFDLLFMSSPFSVEAVQMLERVGQEIWKIPSGGLTNPRLLEAVKATGKPILLSTGMSTLAEIDTAVAPLLGNTLCVMQCTSRYPCPPEKIGLTLLSVYKSRYGCLVGLSDHSGTIYPSLLAVSKKAAAVEVHVTLSRNMSGPDVAAAITIEELRSLVDGVSFIETMQAHVVDKDKEAVSLAASRKAFGYSVVVVSDMPAGTILNQSHLAVKKPGTGIPAADFGKVLGCTLLQDVKADHLFSPEDLWWN